MSGQRVLSFLSKSFAPQLQQLMAGGQKGTLNVTRSGLQFVSPRRISLFHTIQNNKKTAPNAHINDAKARPAEQGLRIDEDPKDVGPSSVPRDEDCDEEVLELKEQLNAMSIKSREFEDKYMRALAETENVRNRLTKQIQDSKLFAIQGFCKDLTEIEDILRLAIDSVPKDQITNDNKHLKNLYEGLTLTNATLVKVFKNHGLISINPIDTKFNPNEHEAVAVQEIPGKESGTVVFVSKLGYKLHDRVIRPAVVGVAK